MSEASSSPLSTRFQLDPAADGLELAQRWAEARFAGGFPERVRAYPTDMDRGRMTVRCDLDPGHANFIGLVHGGVTATLADIAGGGAAMTLLKSGEHLLSTDLQLRFLNAAPIDAGHLIAEGRAAYVDPRKVVAEITISLPDGRMVAHGSAAVAIRRQG